MANKTKPSQAKALVRDQRVSAALAKHFARSATISLGGTTYKVSELQQMLADRSDAVTSANAVKAQWVTAVAAANAKTDAVTNVLTALRQHVLGTYGTDSALAVDLGFSTKRKSPTAATTEGAVQKRRAKSAAKKAALATVPALLAGQTPPSAPVPVAAPVTPKPAS